MNIIVGKWVGVIISPIKGMVDNFEIKMSLETEIFHVRNDTIRVRYGKDISGEIVCDTRYKRFYEKVSEEYGYNYHVSAPESFAEEYVKYQMVRRAFYSKQGKTPLRIDYLFRTDEDPPILLIVNKYIEREKTINPSRIYNIIGKEEMVRRKVTNLCSANFESSAARVLEHVETEGQMREFLRDIISIPKHDIISPKVKLLKKFIEEEKFVAMIKNFFKEFTEVLSFPGTDSGRIEAVCILIAHGYYWSIIDKQYISELIAFLISKDSQEAQLRGCKIYRTLIGLHGRRQQATMPEYYKALGEEPREFKIGYIGESMEKAILLNLPKPGSGFYSEVCNLFKYFRRSEGPEDFGEYLKSKEFRKRMKKITSSSQKHQIEPDVAPSEVSATTIEETTPTTPAAPALPKQAWKPSKQLKGIMPPQEEDVVSMVSNRSAAPQVQDYRV